MKNKKSQIGATLTWFAAFIIIFFVIILFITASIIFVGKKEMSVLSGGRSSIGVVQYDFEDLELNRALIHFLNTPIEFKGEKIRISRLITKWDISEGAERKNIEEILQQELNQAVPSYSFAIKRDNPGVFFALENNPGKVSGIYDYKFSLIYIQSSKGMLKVSLSFNKYEGISI